MRFFNKLFSSENTRKKQISEMKAFRSVGQKFNYLGVEIMVTDHCSIEDTGLGFLIKPELQGNYVNNSGEIVGISFDYKDLPAIISENETKQQTRYC